MPEYLPGALGAAFVVVGIALIGLPLGLIAFGMLGVGLCLIGTPLAFMTLGVFLLLVDRRVG